MASTARFDELKKKFDENPRRYFAPLANEFRKSGDAEQAVMICEEFLPQQPGHMSGHIVYGQALFDLGRLDDARTVFETALTLDPENLIALRHLGDIARQHGDSATARHWYERVLESDPRNEDVQTLIADLDHDSGSGPASHGGQETAPIGQQTSTEPARSVEQGTDLGLTAAFDSPAPPPLPTSESLLELDVVEEHALAAPSQAPSAPTERIVEPSPLDGLEPTAAGAATRDDGRAEGFEPMEFTPPSAAPATGGIADELESGEFAAPSAPVAPLAGLEESAVGAFEARPAAASQTPLPELEPTDFASTSEPAPRGGIDDLPVDIPPEVIAAEAELIDARELLEPGADADAGRVSPTEPAEAASSAVDAPTSPPPRVTPSQPFVTETMAELYVKQGFREQALDVYKLLLAASPENPRLRERVAELQGPPAAETGPNVREFFARLATRRPGDRAAAAEPPASSDFASFDSFETVPAPTAPDAHGSAGDATLRDSGDVTATTSVTGGSIDALFTGQRPVGPADASAASALAQAFAGDVEAPPISGRPARAAAGELSLDSVFRDGGARPPRSAQSFSFDQFFSESAASEPSPSANSSATPSQGTGTHGEPAQRSEDDIEQFNSWLQGLKQR